LRFEFVDYPAKMRLWWLVVTGTEVDICLKDPGHDVDLLIQTTLKTMTQVWMGDLSVTRARREGLLRVTGNSVLNRSMASWIGCSSLATVKPARKRSA
jgi:hypothetical protein